MRVKKVDKNTMIKVINGMAEKIDDLAKRYDDLVKVDNNIIECMDDLEAKNYQIKRDVDELTNNGGNNE